MADLYDTGSMPEDLCQAHLNNDKVVIAAYGFTGKNEEEITKMLLQQYKKLRNEE